MNPERKSWPPHNERRATATHPASGCLHHRRESLAFSKLAAGRENDIEFIRELLKYRLINRGKIRRLIEAEEDQQLREILNRNWIIVIARRE